MPAVLIGTNSDEGLLFTPPAATSAQFVERVRAVYGQHADNILAAYPHAAADAFKGPEGLNNSHLSWPSASWHGHRKSSEDDLQNMLIPFLAWSHVPGSYQAASRMARTSAAPCTRRGLRLMKKSTSPPARWHRGLPGRCRCRAADAGSAAARAATPARRPPLPAWRLAAGSRRCAALVACVAGALKRMVCGSTIAFTMPLDTCARWPMACASTDDQPAAGLLGAPAAQHGGDREVLARGDVLRLHALQVARHEPQAHASASPPRRDRTSATPAPPPPSTAC